MGLLSAIGSAISSGLSKSLSSGSRTGSTSTTKSSSRGDDDSSSLSKTIGSFLGSLTGMPGGSQIGSAVGSTLANTKMPYSSSTGDNSSISSNIGSALTKTFSNMQPQQVEVIPQGYLSPAQVEAQIAAMQKQLDAQLETKIAALQKQNGLQMNQLQDMVTSLTGGGGALGSQVQNILDRMTPDYTPRTRDQILAEAKQYADLLINPQVSSLQNSVEQARQAAANQMGTLNAAYTAVPERTNRLLEANRQKALEQSISRGGGHSGAVEWLTKELQAPVLEGLNTLEAERMANTKGVAENLALAETQTIKGLQELETMRGGYAEQQAKAIEELEFARQSGNWEKALEAAQTISAINTQYQGQVNEMVMSMMPYLQNTVAQEDAAKQGIVETMGNTYALGNAANAPNSQPTGIRDYLASVYGTDKVDDLLKYTPSTTAGQGVIRLGNAGAGVDIPLNKLGSYGGYLGDDDRAYLPAATIEKLLRSVL